MKLSILVIVILTFIALYDTGCGLDKSVATESKNDTTQILKTLIDSAFYRQRLPDFSSLKRNNPFGDSIIFKFDSDLIGHLPTDQKFKILTEDQICLLATQHYNDTTLFCNFLALNNFKKTDSTFKVSLRNECITPLFDKKGNPRFGKDFYKDRLTYKCLFGFLCGGGIHMTFNKQGDTLKGHISGFSSD